MTLERRAVPGVYDVRTAHFPRYLNARRNDTVGERQGKKRRHSLPERQGRDAVRGRIDREPPGSPLIDPRAALHLSWPSAGGKSARPLVDEPGRRSRRRPTRANGTRTPATAIGALTTGQQRPLPLPRPTIDIPTRRSPPPLPAP